MTKSVDGTLIDSKEYLSDDGSKTFPKVKKGTLLLSFKLSIGKLAIAGTDLQTNEAIAAMSDLNEDLILRDYLYYYLFGFDWSEALEGRSKVKGNTLNKKILEELPIKCPSLKKQQEIVETLDSAFAEIDLLEKNLTEQKSALAELSSGKLDQIFSRKSELDKDIDQIKLSEIARVINGRAYSQPELLKQGTYPVLRVGNFFSNRSWYYSDLELDKDKYCDNGDLLYAWSASFGPRIWDGDKVIYHYHIWKIEEKKDLVLRDWLYWWFLWDVKQIKEAHGTGSTMMHVTKGAMENRLVQLPSLEVQSRQIQQIAELQLSTQKLESNYKILAEKWSDLRRAVLASAFEKAVA
jgi:type I restriction enzyme S subunit